MLIGLINYSRDQIGKGFAKFPPISQLGVHVLPQSYRDSPIHVVYDVHSNYENVFPYLMIGKRKNPSQLTDEDREIINQVVVICVAMMFIATTKYTAKQFAKKFFLSSSKEKNSLLYLLLNTTNKTTDRLYRSEELRKEISRAMLDGKQQGSSDVTTLVNDRLNHYIRSSHMTESLKILEALGAYQNIIDKKEIRHQEKRHRPGKRKASDKPYNDRGGRPSRYKITANVERIKNAMAMPDAVNLLRNRLLLLRIFYEYQKFMIFVLFYALRKNKKAVIDLYRIIYPPEYIQGSEFRTFIGGFSSIDESAHKYSTNAYPIGHRQSTIRYVVHF
jgi:hypothetical protein